MNYARTLLAALWLGCLSPNPPAQNEYVDPCEGLVHA